MAKCKGLYCKALKTCPLGKRAIDDLEIGLLRTYDCEELILLFQKFQEIGKIIKEEKEKCLGKEL